MQTINQEKVRTRIAYVSDTMVAAQGNGKSFKSHVKALEKAVDIRSEGNDASEFNRKIGSI